MLGASDLLAMRGKMAEPAIVQPAVSPDSVWGTQSERPRLRLGGKWIEPTDPMYDFIQKIMLQQLMPQMQGMTPHGG